MRADLVYLPLNLPTSGTELQYFLRDAEPSVFVCSPQRRRESPDPRGSLRTC
jgi:malonyl-CoA/methylmalonyl-CoA synthetase